MSSFNKKQSFGEKMKDEKLRRSYILTAVALCLALVIITVTAVIANRAKDPTFTPDNDTEKSTVKSTESDISTESDTSAESEKSTQKPSGGSSSVSSGLPSFTLPANGTLTNKHDPELQIFSQTMNDYRVHLGIDIQTAYGRLSLRCHKNEIVALVIRHLESVIRRHYSDCLAFNADYSYFLKLNFLIYQ